MWSGQQKKFDQLLEQITNPNVIEQDFASVYQLCDLVKSNAVSPSVALSKLTKKLPPNNRDPMVNSLAWSCLDVMAKNCGSKFHEQLANQDFLQLIRDAIGASSQEKRQKPLELLQSWALGIEQRDSTKLINTMYQSLKDHGYKFPSVNASELRAMYQTSIPAEWKDGKRCFRCRSEFTSFLRKHHCRNCGQVVCASCSSKKMSLPHIGIEEEVRVCETCYNRRTLARTEFVADENTTAVNRQLLSSQGFVDSLQMPDEEAQLKWALEASRREAEERDKQWASFDRSPTSAGPSKYTHGQQNSGAYPDLQKFTDQETVYAGAPMQGKQSATPVIFADYPLVSAKESLASFVHYPAPSSPSTSHSTGSVGRFVRYNASAPSPAETQSEQNSIVSPGPTNAAAHDILDEQGMRGEDTTSKELAESSNTVDGLVKKISDKIGLFNLRLRRNQMRRRSTANDQYARSLCIFLSELEPQLVDQLNELEERRVYYESLQDKLYEIIEIRKALEDLRAEAHRKRLEEQGSIEQQRARLLEQKRAELRAEKVKRQPLLPPIHNMELFQWNQGVDPTAAHVQSHLNAQNCIMPLQSDGRMLNPMPVSDVQPARPVVVNTEAYDPSANTESVKVLANVGFDPSSQSTHAHRRYNLPESNNPSQFTSVRPNLLLSTTVDSMLSRPSHMHSSPNVVEPPLRPELTIPPALTKPGSVSLPITTCNHNLYGSDVSGHLANENALVDSHISYNAHGEPDTADHKKGDESSICVKFFSPAEKVDGFLPVPVRAEGSQQTIAAVTKADEDTVIPLVDDLLLNVESHLNDGSCQSCDEHAETVRPLTDEMKNVLVE